MDNPARLHSNRFNFETFNPSVKLGEVQFVEEWESEQALQEHFALPTSIAFVNEIGKLASSRSQIKLYQATEMRFPKGVT